MAAPRVNAPRLGGSRSGSNSRGGGVLPASARVGVQTGSGRAAPMIGKGRIPGSTTINNQPVRR